MILALLNSTQPVAAAGSTRVAPKRIPVPVDINWVRVSPAQPNHIYVGLDLGYRDLVGIPSDRVVASNDGGATFAYYPEPDSNAVTPNGDYCEPVRFGPDGKHVYAGCGDNMRDAATLGSGDGVHWGVEANGALAISPLNTQRWYDAQSDFQGPDQGGGCFSTVEVSTDSGRHWKDAPALPKVAPYANDTGSDADHAGEYMVFNLVADPLHADTVYANYITCEGFEDDIALVARSRDGGATWTLLPAPRGLQTFWVTTDPHEAGLLVGQTSDKGVPKDRVYLSHDQGQTWQAATCPGDLHGVCPIAIVDNVFGEGQSYAFFKSGIYAVRHNGPAGARLALSDHLPVPAASIADAQGGTHQGDPVYLLSDRANGRVTSSLYRSDDGGHTWRQLPAGVLPNLAAPSHAPGALFVAATHHSVGAPFVATYRRLGLALVGYPITETYVQDGALNQDFQRMRLVVRGGTIQVAAEGSEIFKFESNGGSQPPYDFLPNAAGSAAIFQQFWQRHGGMAVLGAQKTKVYKDPNGDGSGRSYVMQLYENVRLELHPELHNSVLLGLIGYESLIDRGWLDDTSRD